MSKKFLLVLVFLFIFLALGSSAKAVPPVQTTIQESDDSFFIEYAQYSTIKINEPYEYHFHVYNKTNSLEISNNSVSCEGHMYNSKGMKALTLQAIPYVGDDGQVDGFYFNATGGNFSQVGSFAYHVYCNSTIKGGFVSGSISVISGDTEPTDAEATIYLGLLILSLVLFIVSVWITISINGENQMDFGGLIKVNFNKYIKYFMFFISYMMCWTMVFFSWQVADKFLTHEFMAVILKGLYILLTIGIAPILLVTMIFSLVKWLMDLKLHKLYERGLKPR